MQVVVKRSLWLRGATGGRLAHAWKKENYRYCILGFVGLACGVPADEMVGRGYPYHCTQYAEKWPKWALRKDVRDIVTINDRDTMDDHEREVRLATQLLKHGAIVQFID